MFKYQAITKLLIGDLKMEIQDEHLVFSLNSDDWVHVHRNLLKKDPGRIGDEVARRLTPRYHDSSRSDCIYVVAMAVVEFIEEFKDNGGYDVWLVQSL